VISSLRGTVQNVSLNNLVIDVQGVGYAVQVTPDLALSVAVGSELFLHTAFIVREDAFMIFGFKSFDELETFDLLRSVSGVGPKSALSVIHQLGVEELQLAVANEDDAAFKKVSGIGPKTAKLLVVSLAGKIKTQVAGKLASSSDELVAALVGLGYQSKVATDAVKLAKNENPTADNQTLLRAALQKLAK
jgi:Holliday junction DNA helicase RuvA